MSRASAAARARGPGRRPSKSAAPESDDPKGPGVRRRGTARADERRGPGPSVRGAELRLRALAIRQGAAQTVYMFGVDRNRLDAFTTVSRVRRSVDGELDGYQRPELYRHVAEIRRYLESSGAMLPNTIVVAFDSRVRFEPGEPASGEGGEFGTLVIPCDPNEPTEQRPGWIVDGQQRAAALRDARVEEFGVGVTAFISDDAEEQRRQFILVNATRPLASGHVNELLPGAGEGMPSKYERRRLAMRFVERLNFDDDSPLRGLVRMETHPEGVLRANSLVNVIRDLSDQGLLYQEPGPEAAEVVAGGPVKSHPSVTAADGDATGGRATRDRDIEGRLRLLKAYWGAVADAFPDAWGAKPRQSRLLHGAGVYAIGHLMGAVTARLREAGSPASRETYAEQLRTLRPVCAWTSGVWALGDGARPWNGIQNTAQDKERLADFLRDQFARVRS